jgi:hypothetical protein
MRPFVEWVGGVVRLLGCGLVLAALLGGAGPARAQAGLKAELADVSKKIKETMGATPVKVGEFAGPRRLQSSGGPGIAKALTDALKKQKVKVDDNAQYTLDGDFTDFNDEQSGRLAVRITLRLRGPRDFNLVLARTIVPKDAQDTSVQDLLGVSTSLPASSSDQERDDLIRASLKEPAVTIAGTRVSARKGSPYSVEVQVQENGAYVSKTPESVQGRAFIRMQRNDVYAIRLINESNFDAAVTLTIDGLNVFAFSEVKDATGDPRFGHLILPKQRAAVIKGWYMTNDKIASFLVTDLPKSAGGKLRNSSSVGTITASFAVAVPKGAKLPADEPKTRAVAPAEESKSRAVDPNATGLGTEAGTQFRETDRVFGVVRDTISIRYSK